MTVSGKAKISASVTVFTNTWKRTYYNRERKNRFYRFFFSVISFMPLTAWAVISLIYVPGSEPGGEDVTKFLYNFTADHSPLLVSAAAALLFAAGLVIMLRKGIIRNYISEIRSAKQS